MEAMLAHDWISLAQFVEATLPITLDEWQINLCERLQKLRWQTGQRLLVHAPPQRGKSVIVSQRFPAWLLGYRPTNRVKLACYNITHATKFGRVVRDVLRSREYMNIFPSPSVRLPSIVPGEEWSTAARQEIGDAQPSFGALGLLSGFVGQGVDTLLIDDPYSSPQDANSPAVNASVRMFWDEGARVRLNDDTNVVVMFHRYNENDFAGYLLDQGGWELLRYAEEADGEYRGFPDPLGRMEGEKLSPRVSDEFIADQKRFIFAWLSQFQGRPSPRSGGMFPSEKFGVPLKALPTDITSLCRYWDKAGADEGKGDFTVGALLGKRASGRYIVVDVERFQKKANERNIRIQQVAADDRQRYKHIQQMGPNIWIEQPPGLGKESTDTVVKLLAGYPVKADPVHGDKVERADPLASQVQAGNVDIMLGEWNKDFLAELQAFPGSKNDDQVDGSSGAFNKLQEKERTPAPRKAYGF